MAEHQNLRLTLASFAFGCDTKEKAKDEVDDREEHRRILPSRWAQGESTVYDPFTFADIEAMQLHWQGADDRTAQAYEYIEPIGFEIYGSAGEQIVVGMRANGRWWRDADAPARVRDGIPPARAGLI